jgi:hypothetical protein
LNVVEEDHAEPPPESVVERPISTRKPRRWPLRRLALGLSPTPRAGLALLLVGTALGPHGLRVISDAALTLLDPAVSTALAALGVLVGFEIRVRRPGEGGLFAAASLEAAATILVVGVGIAFTYGLSPASERIPSLLAVALGVCAAPSSSAPRPGEPRHVLAARIADLDDVLPIVLGVVAVAWTRPGTPGAIAALIVQGGLIALAIAFAAWLLISQTSSESEQRVFAIGALLLLGGAAAHLSMSALWAGLLAGLFWNACSSPARDQIARDMRYLQHPLVVLLLIVAGARLEFSANLMRLAAAYVVLRTAGKLLGGWLAGRTARDLPRDLGLSLIAPGVAAIAIALDAGQALSLSDRETLFAIVLVGSLGSELLSILLPGQDEVV